MIFDSSGLSSNVQFHCLILKMDKKRKPTFKKIVKDKKAQRPFKPKANKTEVNENKKRPRNDEENGSFIPIILYTNTIR